MINFSSRTSSKVGQAERLLLPSLFSETATFPGPAFFPGRTRRRKLMHAPCNPQIPLQLKPASSLLPP